MLIACAYTLVRITLDSRHIPSLTVRLDNSLLLLMHSSRLLQMRIG